MATGTGVGMRMLVIRAFVSGAQGPSHRQSGHWLVSYCWVAHPSTAPDKSCLVDYATSKAILSKMGAKVMRLHDWAADRAKGTVARHCLLLESTVTLHHRALDSGVCRGFPEGGLTLFGYNSTRIIVCNCYRALPGLRYNSSLPAQLMGQRPSKLPPAENCAWSLGGLSDALFGR